jgi:large repetitive protein
VPHRPSAFVLIAAITSGSCTSFGTPAESQPTNEPGSDGGLNTQDALAPEKEAGKDGSLPDANLGDKYAAVVLEDAPDLYLRLGESSAVDPTKVFDEVLQKPLGIVHQAPLRGVPGAIPASRDTASAFNGDDWVDVGDQFGFSGTSPFTVELWVKPDNVAVLTHLITKELRTTPVQGWAIWRDEAGSSIFERYVEGSAKIGPEFTLPLGLFTHVVATYDGNLLSVFKNGESAGTPGIDARPMIPHKQPLLLATSALNGADAFRGTIDEVAIYSKALSGSRIKIHFDAAK